MRKPRWLITVASWETRFVLGTHRLLEEQKFSNALMFHYEENEDWTKENQETVKTMLKKHGIDCQAVRISFGDPARTWRSIYERISGIESEAEALVDCTTMPRDTLWTSLELLRQRGKATQYVYHQPESYDPEWLSRDPGRPRLVYKLSGIATLGRPICLIITTGFDPERTRQLMWYYEPRRVLLGLQSGDQFDNQDQNVERHKGALKDEYMEFDVKEFTLDAYSEDHGESELARQIEQCRGAHNIVMTSLGPKLGAVALFRLHVKFPETALSYTPSREFNREYSKGISESYSGVIMA